MDSDFCADRKHVCAVYQPFASCRHDFHFIVHPFENQMGDSAADGSCLWADQLYILWTDNHIYRAVMPKSYIYAGERNSLYLYDFIFQHQAGDDIAVSDKIGYKGIFSWSMVTMGPMRLVG